MDDEVTMYLIVRADLKLSKGKLAAQVGHGVQLAMRAAECRSINLGDFAAAADHDCVLSAPKWLQAWERGSYAKIALRVDSVAQLDALAERLRAAGAKFARVVDEGRTEIPAGTTTVLALQPMPRSVAAPFVRDLKLL